MLPLSMRICIRSQDSSSMPCQGDSISRWVKDIVSGFLRVPVRNDLSYLGVVLLSRLDHCKIKSFDVGLWVFAGKTIR
jgi:hypothetical protein